MILCNCGISLDITRQFLRNDNIVDLFQFVADKDCLKWHRAMVDGEIVNSVEHRQALHTSLRAFSADAPRYAEVFAERSRLVAFAKTVREGIWLGCRGDRITDVINIGIGGSEMGVLAAWQALKTVRTDLHLHFLSSVDGVMLERVLAACNPRSTLVVVSSKSFTTRETQVNAAAVDQWLLDNGIVGVDRSRHMVVVSAKPTAAEEMCLPPENAFRLWSWVGGRFSVWSSIGLPLAITLGTEAFMEFLMGANEMDLHSVTTPIEQICQRF